LKRRGAEGRQEQGKQFFFEKKNQKTFGPSSALAKRAKSFLFLFSKRKYFLTSRLRPRRGQIRLPLDLEYDLA
jgi:hypothetical protein